jgi:hypothetical protein
MRLLLTGAGRTLLEWQPRYSDLHTIVETAWRWYAGASQPSGIPVRAWTCAAGAQSR